MSHPKKKRAPKSMRWKDPQIEAIQRAAEKLDRDASEIIRRGALRLADEINNGAPWPPPASTEK